MSVNISNFDCNDLGDNFVVLTITNPNGASDNCVAIVTVVDDALPDVNCKNISLPLNNAGFAFLTPVFLDDNSTDNCGVFNMTISENSFDCDDIGNHQVELTVTDVNGNSAACTSVVSVVDDLAPFIFCNNTTVATLTGTGEVQVDPATVLSLMTDGCGIQESSLSKDFFNCDDIGTNIVTVTVEDINGNISTCQTNIIVEDGLAPAAACENISVELDANGQTTISATQIGSNSSDDCGITSMILDMANFNTTHLGQNVVTLTVTDASNNSSQCTSIVTVLPAGNGGGGGNGGNASIVANTANEDGLSIGAVEYSLNEMPGQSSNAFNNLQAGGSYAVEVSKDINPLNGVTTFDLVLIQQHILQIANLDSPYKIIAADSNNSGNVTTFDLVEIRRLILFELTDFTNNTSWRFVDKNHVFTDPINPWATPFPEVINLASLPAGVNQVEFIGVKVGDVNNSATPNVLLGEEGRGLNEELLNKEDELVIDATGDFSVSGQLKLSLSLPENESLLGMQFCLDFDPSKVEYIGFEKQHLDVDEYHFGKALLQENKIAFSYHEAIAKNHFADRVFFDLIFSVHEPLDLEETFRLDSRYIKAEAYDAAGQISPLKFQFIQEEKKRNPLSTKLFVQPNPFKSETSLRFHVDDAQDAQLLIYDHLGRLIYSEDQFVNGWNLLNLNKQVFSGEGVYFIKLLADHRVITQSIILIEKNGIYIF